MSRSRLLGLIAALILTVQATAGLQEDVELLIRGSNLAGANVTVSVTDVATGFRLVQLSDQDPMIPASNMKLLTTGAALHVLGPDFAFRTELLEKDGTLTIVGDGDPAFGDPTLLAQTTIDGREGLDVESFLDLWTEPIIDAGFTRIDRVQVDDRIFEREFVHPTWPRNQLSNRWCAEVSGLNFHLNVLHFYPRPTDGNRPEVRVFEPFADWVRIHNRATSKTGRKEQHTISLDRTPDDNEFTVRGNVKFRGGPVRVTAHDMPSFFARLIASRLEGGGVSVLDWGLVDEHQPQSTGRRIGPAITTPIATVLRRCNTDSQNLYAESLFKRTAAELTNRPGSWLHASAILRHVLNERGVSTVDLVSADGSGLSRDNRITARLMTEWLTSLHGDRRIGAAFMDSLAVGGESGTLEKRFRTVDLHGAIVHAKTGFINQVSCLSGYVTMPDGRTRAFSVLVNDIRQPISKAKLLQDKIVAAIAEDMAASPVTLGGG